MYTVKRETTEEQDLTRRGKGRRTLHLRHVQITKQ